MINVCDITTKPTKTIPKAQAFGQRNFKLTRLELQVTNVYLVISFKTKCFFSIIPTAIQKTQETGTYLFANTCLFQCS